MIFHLHFPLPPPFFYQAEAGPADRHPRARLHPPPAPPASPPRQQPPRLLRQRHWQQPPPLAVRLQQPQAAAAVAGALGQATASPHAVIQVRVFFSLVASGSSFFTSVFIRNLADAECVVRWLNLMHELYTLEELTSDCYIKISGTAAAAATPPPPAWSASNTSTTGTGTETSHPRPQTPSRSYPWRRRQRRRQRQRRGRCRWRSTR